MDKTELRRRIPEEFRRRGPELLTTHARTPHRTTEGFAMARSIVGLLVGIGLVFPGIELLRWLATKVFGVYPDMTLTEACLSMIIILLSVVIVRGLRFGVTSSVPASAPRPQLTSHRVELYPPQEPAVRSRRRASSSPAPAPRPTTRRRPDTDPPIPSRPRRTGTTRSPREPRR